MKNNFLFLFSKISVKILFDIAFFPVWWYSVGLFRFLLKIKTFLKERWMVVGAGVWIKNLFTPMYGQRDITSRLISFVVRLVQIIFRFITFLFFLLLAIIALILWIALPIAIVYLIWQRIF